METDVFHDSRRVRNQALLWLGLIGLATHLPVWLVAHGATYDMDSYARVGTVLSEGGRLYGDPRLAGRYPYFPAWGLLLWVLQAGAQLLGMAPALWFKLPAVLADLAVGMLIFVMVQRLMLPVSRPSTSGGEVFWMGRPFWAAVAWLANPLPLLIGPAHGQFDSVALAFILAAAWYLEFSERPHSDLVSALCLSFAIAFKTWPIFFLPLFVMGLSSANERFRYTVASLAVPILLAIPFVFICGAGAVFHALCYSGSSAFSLPESLRGFFFGVGAPADAYHAAASAWGIFGMSALALFWILYIMGRRRFPLFAGLALATLTLYVFAPGLSPQYLCWLLPFSLLVPGKLALRHSVVCLLALLLFYGAFMPEAFLSPEVWAPPVLSSWVFLIWALLNLFLWFYFLREWSILWRLCNRPSGRMGLA